MVGSSRCAARRHDSASCGEAVAFPRRGSRAALGALALLLAPLLVLDRAAPAGAAPEPPPRPAEFGGTEPGAAEQPVPAASAPPAPEASADAGAASDCLARLRRAGWTVEAAPQPSPGRPDCQVADPVRLLRLAPADRRAEIQFPDRPVVACRLAEPLGRWVGGIVAPVAAAAAGARLAALSTGPGTECRTRDRIAGAKLSAHATGQAIDVAGFTMADGQRLPVRVPAGQAAWAGAFAAVRTAACGWFTTVLGPGSDVYHAEHLHLDIQQHGSSDRYRICQ